MNIKIYWRNGDVDSVDTTALPSSGMSVEEISGSGPEAVAFWRDRLAVEGWEERGLVLQRSFCTWDGPDELSMASEGGGYCDYTIVSAGRLRADVKEVWVDGIALFLTDSSGAIRPADEIEDGERGR